MEHGNVQKSLNATDTEENATMNGMELITECQKYLPSYRQAEKLLYDLLLSIFSHVSWCETLY